jgi:hypothetical protein
LKQYLKHDFEEDGIGTSFLILLGFKGGSSLDVFN